MLAGAGGRLFSICANRPHSGSWLVGSKPRSILISSRTAAGSRNGSRRAHRINCQLACKPGSVWRLASPRRPFIWDASRETPRATNPDGGLGNAPCTPGYPAHRPSLFGLAPSGVCPAGAVTGTAVRSYRTVSPLLPATEAAFGGLFSVALSLGSPPAAVSRHR